MNEIDFKNWLAKSNKNRKVQSDIVSRLKKIQREMGNCNFDFEYENDKCEMLLKAFHNKGVNDIMAKYKSQKLPIGKSTLNAYSYSLRLYIQFLKGI